MPLLSLTSNSPAIEETSPEVAKKLSSGVAEMLGKPERYVMVQINHNPNMLFAGTDDPLAYVELKSIGLPEDRAKDYSARLCELIGEALDLSPERIYIEFSGTPRHLWGWNGGTF